MIIDALHFEFMRNALAAGLLASVICGVLGTFIVVNRMVFLSGGIAHASYGGIGLALFFGFPYLAGVLGFSLIAAVLMTAVFLKAKDRADTFIGVLWAVGMAIGVILIDLTPGYTPDLMSYLFGSILAISTPDLWCMAGLCAITLFLTGYFYRDMLAISYDDEFARLRGVPVTLLYFVFMGLVAVSIVFVIRMVGLILVIALLTIPPYIAEKYTRSLNRTMILAILLSMVFNTGGLALAYKQNLTSGAAIIMVAAAGFFISMAADAGISFTQRRSNLYFAGRNRDGKGE